MNVTELDVVLVLRDWVKWSEGGGVEPNEFNFTRRAGLCFAVSGHPHFDNQHFAACDLDAMDVLAIMFSREGLHGDYPFNDGAESFELEYMNASHYKNERRVAWAKKIIKSYGGVT